ncbi:hypothetical protein H0E87_009589, partial [Populus deltoides]
VVDVCISFQDDYTVYSFVDGLSIHDERRGIQIIQNALKAPAHTIVSNAGFDSASVLGKLLEQDDYNLGYDAAK